MVQYRINPITEEDFVNILKQTQHMGFQEIQEIKVAHQNACFQNDNWRELLNKLQYVINERNKLIQNIPKNKSTPQPDNEYEEEQPEDEMPEVDLEEPKPTPKIKIKMVHSGEY